MPEVDQRIRAQRAALILDDILPDAERRCIDELVRAWLNREAVPLDSAAAWAKIGAIAELRSMKSDYRARGMATDGN